MIIPNTGDLTGTWGSAALNPDFVALDGFQGGVTTISVTSSPVTLTVPAGFTATPSAGPTQAQNAVLKFSGTLTGNVQATLPMPGYYIIDTFSLAGFSFVLSLRAVGSGEVIGMPFVSVKHVYSDGTNVRFANLQEVGSYVDYGGTTPPIWIAACTKPPLLLCDGSTFNATTYPFLNAYLGGNTLPDFRGRSAFYLNGGTGRLTTAGAGIDGNTLLAAGGSNGVTLATNQVPSLTSVNASQAISVAAAGNGVIPVLASGDSWTAVAGSNGSGNNWPRAVSNSGPSSVTSLAGNNSISVTYTNGSQAIIGSTTPGLVSGIRMIRAA